MKLNRSVALLIFLLLMSSFVFCGKRRPARQAEGPKQIAFVLKTLNNPFFVEMRDGANDEVRKHAGVTLTFHVTQNESQVVEQQQIVESLLNKRVAAICLTPNDSTVAVGLVARANSLHIPFIVVDTKLNAAEAARRHVIETSFIGSDNVAGGELAAQMLARRLGERGDVALLTGVSGQETANSRRDGFLRGIAKFPAIKVVATQTANWEREQAFNVTRAILTAHPQLAGIFASNDEMAIGAARAADGIGRHVAIVGFDYTPDGAAAVASRELVGSVAQDPRRMGTLAVRTAVAAIENKPVPREQPVQVIPRLGAQ